MIPITDEAAALAELNRLAQTDSCPEIGAEDVANLLRKHKRGDVWAASIVRQIGDVVIPTAANRNGHRYRVIRFTQSNTNQQNGTIEPVWWQYWGDDGIGTVGGGGYSEEYTDGNVVWIEDGWDWAAVLWNLNAAAEEAWIVKAGKAINRIDFSPSQGMSVSAEQIYQHCLKQVDYYHLLQQRAPKQARIARG